jgi:hypothetical protein
MPLRQRRAHFFHTLASQGEDHAYILSALRTDSATADNIHLNEIAIAVMVFFHHESDSYWIVVH